MKSRLKRLHDKAWKLFSSIVRKRENYICFTCGAKLDKYTSQAGHFIHKNCLDFDEMNIHCQCSKCNKWLSGNLGEYAIRLIKKYGIDRIDDLRLRGNQVKKFTIGELEDLINQYKKRYKWKNT